MILCKKKPLVNWLFLRWNGNMWWRGWEMIALVNFLSCCLTSPFSYQGWQEVTVHSTVHLTEGQKGSVESSARHHPATEGWFLCRSVLTPKQQLTRQNKHLHSFAHSYRIRNDPNIAEIKYLTYNKKVWDRRQKLSGIV